MTIKSMTGPENRRRCRRAGIPGVRSVGGAALTVFRLPFSSLRRFRRIICRKPEGHMNVPGKTLHRSAWLSQQSLEGPSIRLGKRMMDFRKLAR